MADTPFAPSLFSSADDSLLAPPPSTILPTELPSAVPLPSTEFLSPDSAIPAATAALFPNVVIPTETSTGESLAALAQKRRKRLLELTQEEISEIIALRGKLPQSVVGKRFGIEQTDVSQIQRLRKARPGDGRTDEIGVDGRPRKKDVEVVLPFVYGTIAFKLGKKADEFHSHRWSVFVRGASNETVMGIIQKVVFTLHPSFPNPVRTVEQPPFELNETGWGEFEIGITLWLHPDIAEKPVELTHALKLYPEEDGAVQHANKKAVVMERYDELVFTDPLLSFFKRIQRHPAIIMHPLAPRECITPPPEELDEEEEALLALRGDTKSHPLAQWFTQFSDADEVAFLSRMRQAVRARRDHLEKQRQKAEVELARIQQQIHQIQQQPLLVAQ